MKKCVAALCVTVVLILNLTPAQAEQWEPNPLKTDQERFREQISPINISPREAQIGYEKALQNESTSKQTAQERFRDKISGDFPSIKDVMTGEEKMRQKEFFGYGTVADYMIQKYKDDYANPRIVLELYQYCYNHKLLSPIIRRYNASVGDFSLIYMYLLSHCPAVGKGHFIPISTFFFAASLDYVLARENFLNFDDTLWLRRYFGLID